jgi:hypothetical protein
VRWRTLGGPSGPIWAEFDAETHPTHRDTPQNAPAGSGTTNPLRQMDSAGVFHPAPPRAARKRPGDPSMPVAANRNHRSRGLGTNERPVRCPAHRRPGYGEVGRHVRPPTSPARAATACDDRRRDRPCGSVGGADVTGPGCEGPGAQRPAPGDQPGSACDSVRRASKGPAVGPPSWRPA